MNRLFIILMFITLFSCSKSELPNDVAGISSLIEKDLIGSFSLFPLAEHPDFDLVSDVHLDDIALVGIVNFGSEIRIYPHPYIVRYEIVNDEFQGLKYAFSYCPITKSSLAFKREQTFRASGYLYKDNLTPWDEKTGTIWSQMLIKGLIGEKKNKKLNTIPVIETTWKTVKQYFPKAKVMSSGSFSSKDVLPGDNNNAESEDSPELSDYAYGIIDSFDKVYIFKYSDFTDRKNIGITIQNQNYIVYGDPSKRIINAFKVSSFADYESIDDDFPYVLKHKNGTKYDVFGRGENGLILEKPSYAYIAVWKAWKDFYTIFNFQN